ncbi:MAG TPA: type IV pilus assembly protein PilM [Nitrospiria bacterium]|nr:type IV pilus assembly protein PilM [Nitrospiria bacterium]
MLLKRKLKPLVGLDIGSSAIKIVQLRETRSGYVLERLGVRSLEPELIVDGSVMDAGPIVEVIRGLAADCKLKTKDVALAVSGHSVIVKRVKLSPMSEDELEEMIKWEAAQYIPFDINEVNLDFAILDGQQGEDAQGEMNVALVAVKKDKLASYTSLVTDAGLRPVVMDVDAFALENMYSVNYDVNANEVVALVNIGASVINMNILVGGTFGFTRDISIGGNRYTETIQKELNVSYAAAEAAKRGQQNREADVTSVDSIVTTVNNEVAMEVSRSLDYFRTTTMHDHVHRMVLSGGGAKIKGLLDALAERCQVPLELANPFKQIEIDQKAVNADTLRESGIQAAVAVGLAIRRVGDR